MSKDPGVSENPVSIQRESKDSTGKKSSKKRHKSEDSQGKTSSKKHHKSEDLQRKKRSKKHHKSEDSQETEKKRSKKHRDSEHSSEKKGSKKRKRHDRPSASHSPEATSLDHHSKRPRLETTDENAQSTAAGAQSITNGTVPPLGNSLSPEGAAVDSTRDFQSLGEIKNDIAQRDDLQEPSTESSSSPFFIQTTSFYLPLSPVAQSSALPGLCAEHLSPLILTYSRPFDGVILSYSNARFSSEPLSQRGESQVVLSRSIDEYGVTFVWVTADFVVLRPQKDTWIKGYISVQSESQIGVVCWNLFNASIERDMLPKEWKWVADAHEEPRSTHKTNFNQSKGIQGDGGGYWVDEAGQAIDGTVAFRVKSFETLPAFGKDKNFMSIEGTLLSEDYEEEPGLGESAAQIKRENLQNGHIDNRKQKGRESEKEATRGKELDGGSP